MDRTVLLLDDDLDALDALTRFFTKAGWQVLSATDRAAGLRLCDAGHPELVVQGLEGDADRGLELLGELGRRSPDSVLILLARGAEAGRSSRARARGAVEVLPKPVDLAHLEEAAEAAFAQALERREHRRLREGVVARTGLEALEASPAMAEIARQVRLLAGSDSTVLIEGETGTGKGWVAHLLHSASPRAARPFVEINAAGLSATFLESELFGHEKGAFTDAKERKLGLFETADGGTIFLDEIADLAGELQPKLLKVLESGRFRRLGGTREISVDVRLVAATNRPLRDEVQAGRFREDLYYRLAVFPIQLPPSEPGVPRLWSRSRRISSSDSPAGWLAPCRRSPRGPAGS